MKLLEYRNIIVSIKVVIVRLAKLVVLRALARGQPHVMKIKVEFCTKFCLCPCHETWTKMCIHAYFYSITAVLN